MNARLPFKLQFLDHVGIHVTDLKTTIRWYEETLGLVSKKYPAWGEYPTFLVAGDQGIAVFEKEYTDSPAPEIRIDHFAFRISNTDFAEAVKYFQNANISFNLKDHTHFKSLYLRDPDGHIVELTTPTDHDE